jgi:EAL and modified HD-GYP domain-containing signal transduction protein
MMESTTQDGRKEAFVERVLLSRQPIYLPDMSVFGYELLFRSADSDRATFSDGAQATAQVMVNALMEIGMEQMVGRHLAFINFERKLLMGNYCEALPTDRVVLELLETVSPDADLLKKLDRLKALGYRIALDDFICSEPYLALLQYADFVKIDVLAGDWPEIERTVSIIGKYPIRLIAEKVEHREQVERCKKIGFNYFQGYFFCKPQNLTGKPVPANRLAMMHLLAQLNKSDVRIEELERTIGQDISLSYKLLRYINSAMCGLNRQVDSIRHATVLVGLDKMRVWASLLVFSGFGEASQDVLVTGAVRARMCELLAIASQLKHPERFFLVGLFSVLDAILDRPMAQVLSMLSLSAEIQDALLKQQGELGNMLRGVQAFERRDWNEAKASINLNLERIERTYVEALAWSANLVGLSGK